MNANAKEDWSAKLNLLNAEFPKGTKVEITSGKWKKKWGFVQSVSPGYSQVEIHDYLKSKAKGDAEDEVKVSLCRVKSPYLKKIVEQVWNMPDAEDLAVVEKLPVEVVDYDQQQSPADNKLCKEIVDAMVNDELKEAAGFAVADALSDHDSEDEPVDISEDLPTIEEALLLKVQNDNLMKDKCQMIQKYNDARFEVKQLQDELREEKEKSKMIAHDWGQAEGKCAELLKVIDEKDTGTQSRSRDKAEKWNKVKALFIELLD